MVNTFLDEEIDKEKLTQGVKQENKLIGDVVKFEEIVGRFLSVRKAAMAAGLLFPLVRQYGLNSKEMDSKFAENAFILGISQQAAGQMLEAVRNSQITENPYIRKDFKVKPNLDLKARQS